VKLHAYDFGRLHSSAVCPILSWTFPISSTSWYFISFSLLYDSSARPTAATEFFLYTFSL
jgi:hypothetical protein